LWVLGGAWLGENH